MLHPYVSGYARVEKNVYKERSKALHVPHKCEVVLFAP